ncbi:hypothetical protein BN59_01390 [Legionella massiliensis]|uniref:Outer membrane protein beta-barrel domain-containing protein n=1 Tax=Legionella massiliensis TaxID=1034943 RepID=A0A078KZD3_9GAMM|nr:hypothetical protein [Legionella massiliensis]CDZ77108.1 hypothetical protein BN59_01390 [Legionella massiliensis]CEE12846.1 hypothetical protein BN1094_01390 [Legionella massiliensis]
MTGYLKVVSGFGAAALLLTNAQAGTMGPVVVENHPLVPFVSLEGSWTALDLSLLTSNIKPIFSNKDSWGGRVAAGVLYSYTSSVKFSAETGWAYIGKKKQHKSDNSSDIRLNLDGADLLVGVLYQPNNFGFFVKGGTLFENARYKYSTDRMNGALIANQHVTINSQFTGKTNQTYVLPEIKVGAVYDMERWGLSLAYTHAFGTSKPRFDFQSNSPQNNLINLTSSSNLRGPQINSVLFGAYYKFA